MNPAAVAEGVHKSQHSNQCPKPLLWALSCRLATSRVWKQCVCPVFGAMTGQGVQASACHPHILCTTSGWSFELNDGWSPCHANTPIQAWVNHIKEYIAPFTTTFRYTGFSFFFFPLEIVNTELSFDFLSLEIINTGLSLVRFSQKIHFKVWPGRWPSVQKAFSWLVWCEAHCWQINQQSAGYWIHTAWDSITQHALVCAEWFINTSVLSWDTMSEKNIIHAHDHCLDCEYHACSPSPSMVAVTFPQATTSTDREQDTFITCDKTP